MTDADKRRCNFRGEANGNFTPILNLEDGGKLEGPPQPTAGLAVLWWISPEGEEFLKKAEQQEPKPVAARESVR